MEASNEIITLLYFILFQSSSVYQSVHLLHETNFLGIDYY